ncbi:hypothetical protein ACFYUD_16215 [Nocardia tengchongensis]|uniref:hypothetical protein n=1 Tax=Nocardia tengchongensis TaxID=2055889 RepID=UPI0036957C0A
MKNIRRIGLSAAGIAAVSAAVALTAPFAAATNNDCPPPPTHTTTPPPPTTTPAKPSTMPDLGGLFKGLGSGSAGGATANGTGASVS